jgi:hypothetical protein
LPPDQAVFKVEKLGEASTQSVAWLEFADAHRKRPGPNRLKGDALIGRDGSHDLNGTAFTACFAQCVEIANGAFGRSRFGNFSCMISGA